MNAEIEAPDSASDSCPAGCAGKHWTNRTGHVDDGVMHTRTIANWRSSEAAPLITVELNGYRYDSPDEEDDPSDTVTILGSAGGLGPFSLDLSLEDAERLATALVGIGLLMRGQA